MSINKKMVIALGSIFTVALLISISFIYQLRVVDTTYSSSIEKLVPILSNASAITTEAGNGSTAAKEFVLGHVGAEEEYETFKQNMETYIASTTATATTDASKELVENLTASYASYVTVLNEVFILVKANDLKAANELLQSEVNEAEKQLKVHSSNLEQGVAAAFTTTNEANTKETNITIYTGIGLTIFLSLVIGAILMYLNKTITKPIQSLNEAVKVVASGNLAGQPIDIKSKDELGALATSFNDMKTSLSDVILLVKDGATNVSGMSTNMQQAITNMTAGSIEIGRSIQEVLSLAQQNTMTANDCASSMEETATGVQRIAEATQKLQEVAVESVSLSASGQHAITDVTNKMNQIADHASETTTQIRALASQSNEITAIIQVITDITDQTNLLALNAAIEAARAGEAGKGFAVVADEVRHLAEQSKQSAEQIRQLIEKVQEATQEMEASIVENNSAVEEGVRSIHEAGTSFTYIAEAVHQMQDEISDVSAVTEQLSASAQEVAASVTDIANAIDIEFQQLGHVTNTIQEIGQVVTHLETASVELNEQAVAQQKVTTRFEV